MTWRASTSLHSHGKHLLPTTTDGVPLWVLVIHCQPQATQKKWRSTELIVDNDGMGHDADDSECLVPLHKHEGPQWKAFWWRFCQGLQTRRAFGAVIPKYFLYPRNFVVLRKIYFKHMIKIKIFSFNMYFVPPNLKTWIWARFCQNCLCN